MPEQTSYEDDDAMLRRVLHRSATDREFRTRLIAQPDSAIEEILGVSVTNLQAPIRVKFVEKDPGVDALVVLPDFQDPEGELSDAELEAVVGGDWCITSCGFSIDVCFQTARCEGFCGSGGGSSW